MDVFKNYECEGQMDIFDCFAENGNIKPCPYTKKCMNYPAGCRGESFWCGRDAEDLKNGVYERRKNGSKR